MSANVPTFTAQEIAQAVERINLPAVHGEHLADMLALMHRQKGPDTEATDALADLDILRVALHEGFPQERETLRRFIERRVRGVTVDFPRAELLDWQLVDPQGRVKATERTCILAWARIDGYKPTVENLLAYEQNGWRVQPVPRGVAPCAAPSSDGGYPEGFDSSCGLSAHAMRTANGIMTSVIGKREWDVPMLAAALESFRTAGVLVDAPAAPGQMKVCGACGTHTLPGSGVCMRKRGHKPPPGCIAAPDVTVGTIGHVAPPGFGPATDALGVAGTFSDQPKDQK